MNYCFKKNAINKLYTFIGACDHIKGLLKVLNVHFTVCSGAFGFELVYSFPKNIL